MILYVKQKKKKKTTIQILKPVSSKHAAGSISTATLSAILDGDITENQFVK